LTMPEPSELGLRTTSSRYQVPVLNTVVKVFKTVNRLQVNCRCPLASVKTRRLNAEVAPFTSSRAAWLVTGLLTYWKYIRIATNGSDWLQPRKQLLVGANR
jgi:hypothetical protein